MHVSGRNTKKKTEKNSIAVMQGGPFRCGTPLTWIVAICKEKVKRN